MEESTITLTFGDVAENHVGMQKIGDLAESGFTYNNLIEIQSKFQDTELINMGRDAYVLIIRDGVTQLGIDKNELWDEQIMLNYDTKALMRGKVVNKKARYNLCFGSTAQEPNYELGNGRIYAFNDVPILNNLRDEISKLHGKAQNLNVESNYYYDINKCYIGYHGYTERKRVIGVRLGSTFKLKFRWYHKFQITDDDEYTIDLNNGDMYIMNEKAVGTDWRKSSIYTLRHSASI